MFVMVLSDFVGHVRRRVAGKGGDASGQGGVDDGSMDVDEKPPVSKRAKKADSHAQVKEGSQSKTITSFFKPQE